MTINSKCDTYVYESRKTRTTTENTCFLQDKKLTQLSKAQILIGPSSRLEKEKNRATLTGFPLSITLYCGLFIHVKYAFHLLSSRCHKYMIIKWPLGLRLQV